VDFIGYRIWRISRNTEAGRDGEFIGTVKGVVGLALRMEDKDGENSDSEDRLHSVIVHSWRNIPISLIDIGKGVLRANACGG
jgi:hypothetical protein